MDKINELLNGTDIYNVDVSGFVPEHIKNNAQTGYLYVQTVLLAEILKEIKELKEIKVENKVETKEVKGNVKGNKKEVKEETETKAE